MLGASQRSRWSEFIARLGDQRGAPRVRSDRRARDLDRDRVDEPRGRTRARDRRAAPTSRGAASRSAGCSRSLGPPLLAAAAVRSATRVRAAERPAAVPAARGRRRGGRRAAPGAASRRSAVRCSRTGSSRRRSTRSRSPRARTCSRSCVFLVVGGVVSGLVEHRQPPHRRCGAGPGRGRDARRARRDARQPTTIRCRSSSRSSAPRSPRTSVAVLREDRRRMDASRPSPASRCPARPEDGVALGADRRARGRSSSSAPALSDEDVDVLQSFAAPGAGRGRAPPAARRRRRCRRAWPRRTSCGPRCSPRCRTTCARRSRRSRRRSRACCSATSTWTPEATREFLETIDEETRPAQRARRQPARHEPAADRRDAARHARRRARGGRAARARRPAGPAGAGRARRARDAAAGHTPTCRLLERAVANVVDNARVVVARGPGRAGRGRRGAATASTCASIDHGPGIPVDRSRPDLPAVPAARRQPDERHGRRSRPRGRPRLRRRDGRRARRSRTLRAVALTMVLEPPGGADGPEHG